MHGKVMEEVAIDPLLFPHCQCACTIVAMEVCWCNIWLSNAQARSPPHCSNLAGLAGQRDFCRPWSTA